MKLMFALLFTLLCRLQGVGAEPAPQHFVYLLKASRPHLMETLTPEEGQAFAAHQQHLKQLRQAGKLVMAGACRDGAFGLVLLQTDEVEARRLMEEDPIVRAGVLQAEFHPFWPPLLK